MSRSTRILVIGAGAAGAAAIRELAQHEGITTTTIIDTETTTYNRTLINKAVATPRRLPSTSSGPPVPSIRYSVHAVDPVDQTVHLRSGTRLNYEALIVATGIAPRYPPTATASPAALDSERATPLHGKRNTT